jgi:voltage-gated potassium channel Kch
MGSSSNSPAYHQRPRWQWWFLLAATVAILAIGMVAFHQYGFFGAIYQTLQLFSFSSQVTKPSVALQCARWLAALVTVVSMWAVLGGLWRVYVLEFRSFLIGFGRNHVVICGAGRRGAALAQDFHSPSNIEILASPGLQREKVLVIEKDPEAADLRTCHRLGIPYVLGDASDPRVLRTARVHKARLLVAVTGKDGINLEIAIQAARLVEAERPAGEPLRCYMHLADGDLRLMARRKRLVAPVPGKMTISTVGIDLFENSSRWLFQEHPLDWRAVAVGSPTQALLVIIGLGELGESVLVEAVRIGCLANERRLRVIVVDPDAGRREMELRGRYPEIDRVCDLRFEKLAAGEAAVVALVKAAGEEVDTMMTCAICGTKDAANLALALKLGDAIEGERVMIRVALASRSGLALLLSDERQDELFGSRIRPFGMLEDVCNREGLETPRLDALARSIHEVYVREQGAKGDSASTNSTAVAWDDLPEDLRSSNRHAADHFAVKLRAVGCAMVRPTGGAAAELTRDEIEILSRMEHSRFCAERFLAGWRYDPKPKDPVRKTSPTLLPWDAIPDAEREKDREQVRAMPKIIAQAGWSVGRVEPTG